jgi:hypothetical protein
VCRWTIATGVGEWFKGKGPNAVGAVAASADGASVFVAGLDDKLRVSDGKGLVPLAARRSHRHFALT